MEFKNIASNIENKEIFNVEHENEVVRITDEFCQNISGGALSTKSFESEDHETVVNFCDMIDAVCEVVRLNDGVDVSEYDIAWR